MLEIKNVSKSFGSNKAVNNISISLPANKIFGLLGPNGAGKTTLIRMITGIILPDSGNIELSNIKREDFSKYIGYMPEERGLYKKMKVGEQLLYLAQLKGLSQKTAKEKIAYWFNKFDIHSWMEKSIQELSKGMQQKIQFISTVIHEPKLIILDEPFSGLDPINTNLIKEEISQLKENGSTIIFSTHRMEQVEEICEDIALINKGSIILEGNIQEVKERFKKNLFQIRFEGSMPAINSDKFEIVDEKPNELLVKNKKDNPNELLNTFLKSKTTVLSYKEVLPSLNEIFIEKVN